MTLLVVATVSSSSVVSSLPSASFNMDFRKCVKEDRKSFFNTVNPGQIASLTRVIRSRKTSHELHDLYEMHEYEQSVFPVSVVSFVISVLPRSMGLFTVSA
jgi:hypothetical protein